MGKKTTGKKRGDMSLRSGAIRFQDGSKRSAITLLHHNTQKEARKMEGTYRRAILTGVGGPWKIEETPFPELGPGQVLVKIVSASICNQTDLNTVRGIHPPHDHQFNGMIPPDMRVYTKKENDPMKDCYPEHMYDLTPYPSTMGHEAAGIIVAFGPEIPHPFEQATPQDNMKIGDRVGIFHCIGGLGEYVVAQRKYLVPVPESLTDEEAGMFEPMSVTYISVRKSMKIAMLSAFWAEVRSAFPPFSGAGWAAQEPLSCQNPWHLSVKWRKSLARIMSLIPPHRTWLRKLKKSPTAWAAMLCMNAQASRIPSGGFRI